jgi:hypothetical protein
MVSCRTALTNFGKAEAIKFVTIRIVGFVMIDRVGGNLNSNSRWYVLTVRKCDAFENLTAEGRY